MKQIISAKEIHVSKCGSDNQSTGNENRPFLSISRAAEIARSGDVIIVHEGVYRERVNPPRGGSSENHRIVYRAAEGEKVEILGSEIVRGWTRLPEYKSIWKLTISNTFFGDFNPFRQNIEGDWFEDLGRSHHLGDVYVKGQSLYEVSSMRDLLHPSVHARAWGKEQIRNSLSCWYTESNEKETTLWINIKAMEENESESSGIDPNSDCIEISVREACFYPDMPGRNYITVSGFIMKHAATNWAAPTAEQIGLLGTHWSKGWIIEDNIISDSRCSGITLGKDRASGHNQYNNGSIEQGADVYIDVIKRAQKLGWNKDNIGSHIVRNNSISNCEMAGICGSLGAIFSEISGNHIYNIYVKSQFNGFEMAGIKIHAAVDCNIEENIIHDCGYYGIWLDWMAQGTRVSNNKISSCRESDIFCEVNFGPYLIVNNRLLSSTSIISWSEGGMYINNYIAGDVVFQKEPRRLVPRLFPHTTEIARIETIEGGDENYLNNIFKRKENDKCGDDATYRLSDYLECKKPVYLTGNVFECDAENG